MNQVCRGTQGYLDNKLSHQGDKVQQAQQAEKGPKASVVNQDFLQPSPDRRVKKDNLAYLAHQDSKAQVFLEAHL